MPTPPGGVPFTGFVAPTDESDDYPVTDPVYQVGGRREVSTLADRDAIADPRRRLGMEVWVEENGITYRLEGVLDNSGWAVVAGTGDLTYIHPQLSPASVWLVTHNLGKHPSVSVIDSADETVVGDIVYTGLNTLSIVFSAPFSGTAFLN